MKVFMKPVDMIATHPREGMPIPLKYRISSAEGTNKVIKVEKIIHKAEEKLAGNKMFIYRCQSTINGRERIYELKYEIGTCRWFLFKI